MLTGYIEVHMYFFIKRSPEKLIYLFLEKKEQILAQYFNILKPNVITKGDLAFQDKSAAQKTSGRKKIKVIFAYSIKNRIESYSFIKTEILVASFI